MPTKDVDSPILENFKNRKEVYLFSREPNVGPPKAEIRPNGISQKFFSQGGPKGNHSLGDTRQGL